MASDLTADQDTTTFPGVMPMPENLTKQIKAEDDNITEITEFTDNASKTTAVDVTVITDIPLDNCGITAEETPSIIASADEAAGEASDIENLCFPSEFVADKTERVTDMNHKLVEDKSKTENSQSTELRATDQAGNNLRAAVNDITECPICSETLKDAKMLPCIHSFCLNCLHTYGKDKESGAELPCPLCRKVFTVPDKGFEELPVNHFLNKLIDVSKMVSTDVGESGSRQCDACQATPTSTTATGHCGECCMALCDSCISYHRKLPVTRKHKILNLNEIVSQKELLNMYANYCEQHEEERIKFFCYDCKLTGCIVCYITKHKDHKCSDINETAAEVKERLQNDCSKLADCMAKSETLINQVYDTERLFKDQTHAVRTSIDRKYNMLKATLDSHYESLKKELDEIASRRQKELQNLRDECEHELVMMQSFVRYAEEIQEKGSSSDISRASDGLEKRLEELIALHIEKKEGWKQCCQLDYISVEFEDEAIRKMNNIGKVIEKRKSTGTTQPPLSTVQLPQKGYELPQHNYQLPQQGYHAHPHESPIASRQTPLQPLSGY